MIILNSATAYIFADEVADVRILQQEPLHGQLVAALLKHGCTSAAAALTELIEAEHNDVYNGRCSYCETAARDEDSSQQQSTTESNTDGALSELGSSYDGDGSVTTTQDVRHLVTAAQEMYPTEMQRLNALHVQAHAALATFEAGEERENADRLLTEQLLKVRLQILQRVENATVDSEIGEKGSKGTESAKKRRQLPTAALATLKHWLYVHRDNPYPTEAEKRALAKATNLDITQVRNWYVLHDLMFRSRAREECGSDDLEVREMFLSYSRNVQGALAKGVNLDAYQVVFICTKQTGLCWKCVRQYGINGIHENNISIMQVRKRPQSQEKSAEAEGTPRSGYACARHQEKECRGRKSHLNSHQDTTRV